MFLLALNLRSITPSLKSYCNFLKPWNEGAHCRILVGSFFFRIRCVSVLEMAWTAKKPANEPLTGLFAGLLTAHFCVLFVTGPQTSC